ncbi:hypothetical protein CsatB_010081 [Cannabis sativa]
MGDQGVNAVANPPIAPIATTGINIPSNLAAVAASPTVVATPPPATGGIDQSMLLQALKMLEQQRKPVYKLHGTSPFTAEVRQAQLPKGFRLSESLKYKGTSNPLDYLEKFNTIMEVDQVPQLAKCRILAATLEENAHDWFTQLPEASISTWENFVDLFLTHFQATMTYRPPYTTLANIKQESGESLQNYFKRFNAEVTKVEKAPESSLVCMLITGVLPRTDFWKELQARRPESLVEFFAMAEPHKRIENSLAELEKGKNKRRSPIPRSRSRSPRGKNSRGRSPRRRSPRKPRSPKLAKSPPKKESSPKRKGGPRFVNYTELAVPRDHIYAVEERNGVFKKPPPIRGNRDRRDPKKFCKYHKDIGHTTLECWVLQDEIEELIRRGKFDKYRKNEESHPRADDKEENQNASGSRAPRNILTIIGGPHIAGDSRKSQERYAREAKEKPLTNVNNLGERPEKLFKSDCEDIVFMESDARWVHHPHSDALVIIANIGGDNVHRILVDNGSSVNLLNFQAFKQMGLQEKDLRPMTSSIYGFTGDVIAIRGMIILPITLGTAPITAKSMADFAVIDQYSAYNAVIGRPILKEMKIVTSIYHLTMKFPTPSGVGSVRGVQSDSRECYNAAVKLAEKRTVNVIHLLDAPPPRQEILRIEEVPHIDKPDLDPRILDHTAAAQAAEDTIEIWSGYLHRSCVIA